MAINLSLSVCQKVSSFLPEDGGGGRFFLPLASFPLLPDPRKGGGLGDRKGRERGGSSSSFLLGCVAFCLGEKEGEKGKVGYVLFFLSLRPLTRLGHQSSVMEDREKMQLDLGASFSKEEKEAKP